MDSPNLFDSLNETTNNIGSFLEREITKSVQTVQAKLRQVVSKDKNRFVNEDFNLDLTYITERIIAMGYPSSDLLGSSWRNSLPDVKRFFETYHKDHYLILNLCEKEYDATPFNNRVQHMGWPDNHSPSLGLLLYAIQTIHQWLSQDPQHIIAIHCAAGRGRTGTLICSYLVSTIMYEGKLKSALELFASQRSSIGEGLTIPSQIRYVDYVNKLSSRMVDVSMVQTPIVLSLKQIMMRPVPLGATGWKPELDIYCVNNPLQPILLYTSRNNPQNRVFTKQDPVSIVNVPNVILCGDILIKVYGTTELYTKELINSILAKPSFRFAFHTSFINQDGLYLDFKKSELDDVNNGPLISNMYSNDFSLRLLFSPVEQQPQQPQQPIQQQQQQQQNINEQQSQVSIEQQQQKQYNNENPFDINE